MKRLLFYFSILIISSLLFSSCQPCIDGHGELIDEVRDLDSFDKLEVDIPADVVIHIGEFPKISIKTHDNLLGNIKTKVRGKTLIIESAQCIGSVETLKIDLVVTQLNSISVSGSATVNSKQHLTAEKFYLEVNGSGKVVTSIKANTVKSEINGSGNILLSGTAEDLDVEINGSGEFKGLGLKASDAEVGINGSGYASVNAKGKLKVEINGSGEVEYTGSPKIKSDISGSGEVKKVDR